MNNQEIIAIRATADLMDRTGNFSLADQLDHFLQKSAQSPDASVDPETQKTLQALQNLKQEKRYIVVGIISEQTQKIPATDIGQHMEMGQLKQAVQSGQPVAKKHEQYVAGLNKAVEDYLKAIEAAPNTPNSQSLFMTLARYHQAGKNTQISSRGLPPTQ